MVWFVQTSKLSSMLIIPSFAANYQPMTHTKGCTNNWKLYFNKLGLNLVSDKVYFKALLLIVSMPVSVVEFGS